jgi:DNA polymerase-3 subunit epsilon
VVSKLIGRPAGRPAPSATPLNTATPAEAASLIDQFAGAGRAEALTYAWRLISRNGTLQPVLATADDLFFAHDPQLYGLFASEQAAKDMLDSIVDEHSLCRIVLGLEKSRGRKQCSARRLHKCRGACAGSEPVDAHNVRLATALQHVQVQPWPYKNAIGISEGDSIHVIDDWAYLGTAIGVDKASALLQKGSRRFDPEVYRIMQRWLLKPTGSIIAL